jgi:hypothetical protein
MDGRGNTSHRDVSPTWHACVKICLTLSNPVTATHCPGLEETTSVTLLYFQQERSMEIGGAVAVGYWPWRPLFHLQGQEAGRPQSPSERFRRKSLVSAWYQTPIPPLSVSHNNYDDDNTIPICNTLLWVSALLLVGCAFRPKNCGASWTDNTRVLRRIRPEAEETVEHRTYDTT